MDIPEQAVWIHAACFLFIGAWLAPLAKLLVLPVVRE